jgi:hypothetical protein
MIPLPEPWRIDADGEEHYAVFQMRQAINEALELAAQTCTNIAISPSNVILGVAIECRDAIRALIKEQA